MSNAPSSAPSDSQPFDRRTEAGAFLRSRRERLTPAEVGLPQGIRRRTPGLRREEVAMLAGVGTTWYTWLEQGREIQPSNTVLTALAGVLRLDPAERQHLFSLYDRPSLERRVAGEEQVSEALQHMVDGLAEQPAFVLGWRWDVLTWNRAAELVIGTHAGPDNSKPNLIDRFFTDPSYRKLFADWETVARGALATFRADCAPYMDDPDFQSMVARLTRASPEFAAWWPQHDVALRLDGKKRLVHPTVGDMYFAFSMLAVGDRPGMKLFVFTAVDEGDTLEKLGHLLK